MKKIKTNVQAWTERRTKWIKTYLRNEIASIKTGKVITSLSLIATLALVFTMALSSYLIFASESDEIVINDITYTTFTKTGADGKYHSFINLGKYPRTKETNSTIISALGSLTADSKTGIITHPTYGEYVKYSTNYYKVEPIKWEILDIDEETNEALIMTEESVDSYKWLYSPGNFRWDATNGSNSTFVAFPILRMFLNSYKVPDGYFASGSSNPAYADSGLVYTPVESDNYLKHGFLDSAFTDIERALIVKKAAKFTTASYDGYFIKNYSDYVRLLTYAETLKFGFSETDTAADTNRIGYASDYSYDKITKENFKSTTKSTPSYVLDGTSRYSVIWRLMSAKYESSANRSGVVKLDGTSGFGAVGCVEEAAIRPVMTIDLDALYNLSGDGQFATPYCLPSNFDLPQLHLDECVCYDTEGRTKGYIEFGSFPQSEVSDSMKAELEAAILADPTIENQVTGKIEYKGKEYVKDKFPASDTNYHYYEVEPIKWQILDNNNGYNKLLLTSALVLEARVWDPCSQTAQWGNLAPSVTSDKVPLIRAYLNNYKYADTSKTTSYGTTSGAAYTAELIYQETPSGTEFFSKGFLEKAFSDDERQALVKDNTKFLPDANLNLLYGEHVGETYDVIRLLSDAELSNKDYGFWATNATGVSSGRLGFLTDYAKLRCRSTDITSTYKADTGYDVGTYWTSNRDTSNSNQIRYILNDGKVGGSNSATANIGIRPAITLDITNLEGLTGSGTFDDPYRVGIPTPEFTLTVGVKPGDESKGTVTGGGVGSIVHAEAIPNKGFIFDGWYLQSEKVASSPSIDYELEEDTTLEAKFGEVTNTIYAGELVNHNNAGFVHATFDFGSFPKTDVTDTLESTLSSMAANPETGKIEYNGHEYVKENNSKGFTKYYLVEPLSWQILKVETDDEGQFKVTATTESVIESRIFDGQTTVSKQWTNYPTIRTYLNNYDSESPSNEQFVKSASGTEFYNRGFLEKAFSNSERYMIVHNSSEATDNSTQGTGSATCLDKVRLFTDKELRISKSLEYTDISMPFKYGFTESDSPVGFDSNKLGFATDYTLSKYTDSITSYTYIGKDKLGLNTVNYWMNNRADGQNSLNLMYNAGTQNSNPKTKALGIRPIITIIFDNHDDVDITLEANPRSYHDFAFWKIDGVRDTTNTNCLYGSSVDLDKLIKTKAIFTSQVEATINGIDYTSYYLPNENGDIKGYINWGYFPRKKITYADKVDGQRLDNILDSLSLRPDNTVVYDGEKYAKISVPASIGFSDYWFKYEPIMWRVLDTDATNKRIRLLSDEVIDRHNIDNQRAQTKLLWDGTNGSESGNYPLLRFYLNNYKLDCDLTGYRDTTDKPAIGDITQTVKMPIGTTFMNRGFLEKAFSKEESNKIYADTNSFANASTDGAPTTDKVRLMNFYDLTLDKEVVSLNSLKYGFATGKMITGLRTNRMGFLTDLAYAFVSSSTQVDKNYPEYSEIKKYSGVWETSTYSNQTYYNGVHQKGSSNSLPIIYNENGVRPQITLDMSSLGTLVSNDGQIVDGSSSYPYNFESKLLLHTNEITGDDLVLVSPGNAQIDIDMFPGNTISGVYLTSDKTNQINIEGHPDQIIMPNTNYEVYVDVDVTLEGAINATNLGSRYIEKIINSDDYITAINSANGEGTIPNSSKISSELKTEVVETISSKVASNPYALTDGSVLKNDIIEIVGFGPIYTDENGIEYTKDDLVIDDLGGKARWNIADTDGNNLWANVFKKKNTNGTYKSPEEYLLVFTGTEDEIRLFERVYAGDNEFAWVNDYDRSITTVTVYDSDKSDWKEIGITPWSWLVDASKITSAVVSKECNPNSYSCLFAYLKNLKDVKFETYIGDKRTSTYLRAMFWNCNSLTSIQLPDKLDTSEAEDFAYMFNCCESLETLDVSNLDTSGAYDFTGMFGFCKNLKSIDVSNFVTENVETMEFMFIECTDLTEIIGLENFDVSNVTNFYETFNNTSSLENFDVEDWKPAEDCNLNEMFSFSGVKSLDLSMWNVKPDDFSCMFVGCENLESLNLGGWDVTELEYVGDFDDVFYENENIKEIDISGWDMSSVKEYYEYCGNDYNNSIFYGLDSLEFIKVPQTVGDSLIELNERTYYYANIDSSGTITPITVEGESSTEYLYGTSDKTSDDAAHPFNCLVSRFTIYTDGNGIKYTSDDLVKYDEDGDGILESVARWDISKDAAANVWANVFVKKSSNNETVNQDDSNAEYILVFTGTGRESIRFKYTYKEGNVFYDSLQYESTLTRDKSDWNEPDEAIVPWSWLVDKTKIKTAIISKECDISSYYYFFARMKELESFIVEAEEGEKKTPEDLNCMFIYCENLKSFDFSNISLEGVDIASFMFNGCKALTSIDLSNQDMSKAISLSNMFNNCTSLTSINLSNVDASNVQDMSKFLYGCSGLGAVDLSTFKTTNKLNNISSMFDDANIMTTLTLGGDFDTSGVQNMSSLFKTCRKLTTINNIDKLNTSNVTNMQSMFENCEALTNIDLSNFDTSKVTNMNDMFNYCIGLSEFTIPSNFDTSSVKSMSGMFGWCTGLTKLNLPDSFVITSVDSSGSGLSNMFLNCKVLKDLDLSKFATNSCKNFSGMFQNCFELETLDISNMITRSDANCNKMFYDCKALKSIDLSNFNIGSSATVTNFFTDSDTSLNKVILPASLDASKEINLPANSKGWYLYENGVIGAEQTKLISSPSTGAYVAVPGPIWTDGTIEYYLDDLVIYDKDKDGTPETKARWNISEDGSKNLYANVFKIRNSNNANDYKTGKYVLVITGTERDAKELNYHSRYGSTPYVPWTDSDDFGDESLKIVKAVVSKESNPDNYNHYFNGLSNLTDVIFEVNEGEVKTPITMNNTFTNSGLTSWTAPSSLDVSKVTDMWGLFNGCENLTSLDLTNFKTYDEDSKTSKLIYIAAMFQACPSLTTLKIPNLNTSEVTDMNSLFAGSSSLTSITFPSTFTTSKATALDCMFAGCESLASLDLSNFNTANVTNMSWMFKNCEALTSLTLPDTFDTSSVTEMTEMFDGCINLAELNLGNSFNTSNVEEMDCMFASCESLTSLDLGDKFDTSSVYNFASMFRGCSGLTSLDLGSKFVTSGASDIALMFRYCSSLTSLDLSNFDINVSGSYECEYFLDGCTSLSKIILPKTMKDSLAGKISLPGSEEWYLYDKVTGETDFAEKEYLLAANENKTYLAHEMPIYKDLNGIEYFPSDLVTYGTDKTARWNISSSGTGNLWGNVFYMKKDDGSNDTSKYLLVITGTETSAKAYQGTTSSYVPWSKDLGDGNKKIVKAVVSKESNPSNYDYYFEDLENLIDVIFESKEGEVKTPTSMKYTFSGSGLTSWTAPSSLDVSKVTSMASMFYWCQSLESLDLTNFNTSFVEGSKTSKLTNTRDMFRQCTKLETLKITNLNTSEVTDMSNMFLNCIVLSSLNLPSTFSTSKVQCMDAMFCGLKSITELQLPTAFDTSKAESMMEMFSGCEKLTSLDLGNGFDTSQVENMSLMFDGCSKLESINFGNKFDTNNVDDFSNMFNGCSSLTNLDLSKFDFNGWPDVDGIFEDCSSLVMITLPNSIENSEDLGIELPEITGKTFFAYDEDNFSDLTTKTVLIPKGSSITGSSKGAAMLSTNVVVGISDSMFDSLISLNREYSGSEVDTYHTSVMAGDIEVPITLTVLFEQKDTGDNLDVTITPMFTKDEDKEIYSFSKDKIVKENAGKITPKTLTYEAVASNKTYNGNVSASVSIKQGTLNGVVDGENPEITLQGTFANKNAGDNKAVTVTASCSDSNYQIGSPSNAVSANITKKDIHVDGKVPDDAQYEEGAQVTVNFTLRESEKVTGDDLSLSKSSCKGTISGAGLNVLVTIEDSNWPALSGSDLENYNLVKTSVYGNVKEMDLSSASFTLTLKEAEFDYDDGKPLSVEVLSLVVTSPISKTLTEDVDFKVTFPDGNWEPGKHSVKIEFIGNYKGNFTLSDKFTVYGHLDKVTMKDRESKPINNVYKNEFVYFNKKFNDNPDNKIMYSLDNGTTWSVMTQEKTSFIQDETLLVKQTLEFYRDSEVSEFKFHILTNKDIIDALCVLMNDSDNEAKKKNVIKSILDDDRNINLIFDKNNPNEEDLFNALTLPSSDNENVDVASSYLSKNIVPDGITDDEKSTYIKTLIKEALDANEFATSITHDLITDYEEAMIEYEKLNSKLKEVFPEDALTKLEINYYSSLESKGHQSKDEPLNGNKIEVFGLSNHLDNDLNKKVKLKVERLTDIERINIMQALLKSNNKGEMVIAPYDIKLVNADDEEEIIQPDDAESVLVKIALPKEYARKIKNAYTIGQSLEEVSNLNVQTFNDTCFVYFDASHFSDYFLTTDEEELVSIETSQTGDLSLGRVSPTGFTLKEKGTSHTLSFTNINLNKANKALINVYMIDSMACEYKLDESKSGFANLNRASTYTISSVNKDIFVDVWFEFDESFKEEPKPSGGGGGGSGGGNSITIGTMPLDDKGQILSMHKAFMNGYEDNSFRPQNFVTREEVATIVARCHEQFTEEYNYAVFNDFSDAVRSWAKNYIGFCKYKGLIHGYEDGSFKPTNNMTRAELAVLVNNFLRVQNFTLSSEELEKPAFSDVDGRWYEKDVNKLAAMGILNGYEDGTFRGDQFVTRIEVAIVMNKINGRTVKGEIPDEYKEKVISAFKDVDSSRWFFGDVAEAGIDHPADLY